MGFHFFGICKVFITVYHWYFLFIIVALPPQWSPTIPPHLYLPMRDKSSRPYLIMSSTQFKKTQWICSVSFNTFPMNHNDISVANMALRPLIIWQWSMIAAVHTESHIAFGDSDSKLFHMKNTIIYVSSQNGVYFRNQYQLLRLLKRIYVHVYQS